MKKHYAKSGEEIGEGWWLIIFNREVGVANIRNYDGVLRFSTPWLGGDAPEIGSLKRGHEGFEVIRKLDLEALAEEVELQP